MDNKFYTTFKEIGRKEFGDVIEVDSNGILSNRYGLAIFALLSPSLAQIPSLNWTY